MLRYRVLPENLAICRLAAGSTLPQWSRQGGFFSVTNTAEELSIVCEESRVPAGTQTEKGWVALKLQGPFPFTLTGALSSFLSPLAEAKVPIFAISTFDTDYVLIKREHLEQAVAALAAAGHVRQTDLDATGETA